MRKSHCPRKLLKAIHVGSPPFRVISETACLERGQARQILDMRVRATPQSRPPARSGVNCTRNSCPVSASSTTYYCPHFHTLTELYSNPSRQVP